jgi:hypothetical protein
MDESDLVLDPREYSQLVTPAEAVNYVRSKIQIVRERIRRQPPPPTTVLSSQVYMVWHNKVLILYGRAVGALIAAQAFGVITVEQAKLLKNELIAVTLRRTAEFQFNGV